MLPLKEAAHARSFNDAMYARYSCIYILPTAGVEKPVAGGCKKLQVLGTCRLLVYTSVLEDSRRKGMKALRWELSRVHLASLMRSQG